jgi:hypothetical protein
MTCIGPDWAEAGGRVRETSPAQKRHDYRVGNSRGARACAPPEREEVPMPIVGGLDIHRKQITFDYPGTETGQVRRGQISPGRPGAPARLAGTVP